MAVWANGPKILNRVDCVRPSECRQRSNMMNVDESSHKLAVDFGEVKSAHTADCLVK